MTAERSAWPEFFSGAAREWFEDLESPARVLRVV
jgi:hypothetical protein